VKGLLVLAAMGEQAGVVQKVWMKLFCHVPELIGGCRPIHTAGWLRSAGWDVEYEEQVAQLGLRSEVLAARPQPLVTIEEA